MNADAAADGAGLAGERSDRGPPLFGPPRRRSSSGVALGVVGLTSHYCLTNAFRAGDATVVVPIDFLRIPLIALVGWLFYGEASTSSCSPGPA